MRWMWCINTWKKWTTLQILVVVIFLCSSNNLQYLQWVFPYDCPTDISNLICPNGHHCPPPCSQTYFTSWVPRSAECLPHPSRCPSQESGFMQVSSLSCILPRRPGFQQVPWILSPVTLHHSSPPVPLLIYEFRALSLTSTAVIALYSDFALTSNFYLKKLPKTVKLFTSGGMLVREDSVDVFFFVSVSGGKRKKSSEKPSLRVSQRVPVQLHTSCSEKQESERPKAKVLVLHGRPTKIHFSAPLFSPWGGAPFLEVLQYQVRARSGWSNLVSQLPAPKIHLIYCPWIEGVSDIKLVSVGNFKGANKGRRYLLLLLAASSCLYICLKAERKFLHVFIY